MPAARCFLLLGCCTALFIGAFLSPSLAVLAAALDAAVLGAAALDWSRARRLRLSASRSWPPLLVQGAPVEVAVEICLLPAAGGRAAPAAGPGAADRPRRATEVLLREGLHPALAAAPLHQRVVVRAERPSVWRYRLVPRRRGEHVLGPLTARVLGPWGLAWAQRDLLGGERVRVYPQVRWEGRVGQLLAAAQRQRLGQVALRLQGIGSEPYGLRGYLPGDPLGKVHWKATARHGRMVSREDTWERSARLVVLLDCARTMASMDGNRSKLDYALAAALALTRVAAARGDQVSLIAFSDRLERLVRVRSGARSARQAYAALFDLQARLTEPAYDLAVDAIGQVEARRATAVLLTSVVDLAAADLLRESLLRLAGRHRPLLINLEDPELRRLAAAEPRSPVEAFAQVASLEIGLANRRLAKHLRRGGIRVVSSAADQLTLETLEAYLALYRGRAAPALAATL
ncbi:MAG: DUF58 domain-containing protein [Acidobacteria bacterium]|nr:DUF58 domain-containing protein [Acidobacteriota bacterium]